MLHGVVVEEENICYKFLRFNFAYFYVRWRCGTSLVDL